MSHGCSKSNRKTSLRVIIIEIEICIKCKFSKVFLCPLRLFSIPCIPYLLEIYS